MQHILIEAYSYDEWDNRATIYALTFMHIKSKFMHIYAGSLNILYDLSLHIYS